MHTRKKAKYKKIVVNITFPIVRNQVGKLEIVVNIMKCLQNSVKSIVCVTNG